MAIRTLMGAVAGQGSPLMASWSAQADATASLARSNTAKKLSPSPRSVSTWPACAVMPSFNNAS
jgi:hypothetical protein